MLKIWHNEFSPVQIRRVKNAAKFQGTGFLKPEGILNQTTTSLDACRLRVEMQVLKCVHDF
jgi:hypothetical protein